MCFQACCTCCCHRCSLPTLTSHQCAVATLTDDFLRLKIAEPGKCKRLSSVQQQPTVAKIEQYRRRRSSSWSKWALWGRWLLLNHLWFCVLSLAIPSLPPGQSNGNNNNIINVYRSSSKQVFRSPMTTTGPVPLRVTRKDGALNQPLRTRYVSNSTKRTFPSLFSVPTDSSWNSSSYSSSSPSSASSPSLLLYNDNAPQQSFHKEGRSLRPVQPISSPPLSSPPDILFQPSEENNVTLSTTTTTTALVPKTNLSSGGSPHQKENDKVTTVKFHSLNTAAVAAENDDTGKGNDDDPARTTVLEIIDRSPFILNLPITLHSAHIDPIVKRMLGNGTGGGQLAAAQNDSSLAATRTAAAETTANKNSNSSEVEDHLIRAGRQTHHDFIKRILNAVSVDSHNVNRYVHLVRPKGRPQLSSSEQGVTDLGLPPEIADEYIDGVNPPKFPGFKGFHPLLEKNDWRGPLRQASKPKKPGPLVTVVDPDKELPNLYSNKPATNRPNKPTLSNDKPKHFYPENASGPMQPVIKQSDSQQQHQHIKLQPVPRPPQYPLPKIPAIIGGQHEDNLSLNNRNVLKTKLSVLPLAQSSRDNAKHDLSLLLKQEFDAKNAELNQTKAQPMAISPAGQVLLPPPPASGPKHFFASSSSSSQSNEEQKLNKSSTTTSSSVNPLSGPPYQLPVELMNNKTLLPTTTTANNADMKEGVHYKTVSSLVLPPELTSTTTSTTTERSTGRTRTSSTKLPKNRTKHKEVIPVTDKDTFVRVRTGVRRPRPKSTTTTTTTAEPALDSDDDDDAASTPPSTPSTSSPSSTTNRLPPPITSPKFVTTISNDVRFQVESSNRPNFTQYKPPPLSPPLPPPPPPPSENINELELNSDESRLQFNTSLHDMPPGSVPPNNHNNNNSSITTAAIDDSVSIVPTRPQSTGYRLTTERLAYILIGSCCGLAVLVLIIVAMSVRCKDMCSEYRSWKSAEKAALRWHRHNRRRRGGGLTGASAGLPYPMLSRARFNLPRYFRTSIDNAKLRPPQPPMEPYGAGTGGGNSSADPFADKVLGNILQGEGGEITGSGSVSGAGACCHCIDCSSTFFFRNDKHGGWCCQRGYYQPPRRTKLPFGAASSVNTFMPRFAVDHNGDIKTNHHHHHHLQHMDLASGTGDSAGGGSQEPILGRLQRNASEPNLDMCFNELNDSHSLVGRNGFDGRLREKANSSGAIPVKVNMSSRFFDDAANHPHHHHHHHDHHHQQQSSRFHRSNKGPLFGEIDDDEEEDNDDDGGDVTTDFSNVFETNFDDALGRPPRGKSKTGMTGSHCNNNNNRTGQQQYNQKCSVGPPIKHRSDQTGGDKADHPQRHQHRRHQHNHHSHNHQSHSHNQHQSGQPTEYYNPSTGRYYFDSTSIAKPPLGAVERSAGGAGLNNGMNGESSTIWINSSKLVDKLHRKHQASRRKGGGEGGGGGGGGGHRRGHDHGHHRPTTPEDSSDGAHRRRPTKYHHHQQQQQHRSGPHHQNQPNHHQQRSSASAQFQQQQQQQCHTHFDPGLFARLGLPGKLTGNEHNFVVWNDTSERLI